MDQSKQATISPLASIFGSGFLIIAPILASVVGRYAVFAMALVCFVSYLMGEVIRHNIRTVEPILVDGSAPQRTRTFERISDVALIPAYVVSVTLYLKILASFALEPFDADSQLNENIASSLVLAVILILSLGKGLDALEFLEKYALIITLTIIACLAAGFLRYDILAIGDGGITWPEPNENSAWNTIRIVAGTLIVVQGFEISRYMQAEFDTESRVKASRNAQLISAATYIGFVAVTTPVMHSIDLKGEIGNNKLIEMTQTAAPILVAPLIAAAVLSQFSAAIADIVGASGNTREVSDGKVEISAASVYVICAALVTTWLTTSEQVVALASRAFAFYYLIQCIVGLTVAKTERQRFAFIVMALVMAFVALFAQPS